MSPIRKVAQRETETETAQLLTMNANHLILDYAAMCEKVGPSIDLINRSWAGYRAAGGISLEEFLRVYPARFAKAQGPLRPVVERVLRGFLTCGLVEHGFARPRHLKAASVGLCAPLPGHQQRWALILPLGRKSLMRTALRRLGREWSASMTRAD